VTAAVTPHWVALVYELLDAHTDTVRLAQDLDTDQDWAAHLEYLRQLQRVGRELLAYSDRRAESIGGPAKAPPTTP
jgi:hypothetical protein